MLRWLLILAMALLPWHGWAGASLGAAAMPAAQAVPAGHAGPPAATDRVADPGHASADCAPGHADAGGHHDAGAGPDDGCPGCAMCHSCSPAGLPALASLPEAGSAIPEYPAAAACRFASAERSPGLKPPIA